MRSKRMNRKMTHRKRKKRTKNKRTKNKRTKYRRNTKSKRRKSKRRKKSKRGKKNHRMLKRMSTKYVTDYRSIHDTSRLGTFTLDPNKYPHLIPQMGDCALCTLDFMGFLPPVRRERAIGRAIDRLDPNVQGSEALTNYNFLLYLSKTLNINYDTLVNVYKFAYHRPRPDKNFVINGSVNRNNIDEAILKMAANLEPRYSSPLFIQWVDPGTMTETGGHMMVIGMTEDGDLMLIEPQDMTGSLEGKILNRIGYNEVKRYFSKDAEMLYAALVQGNYIDNKIGLISQIDDMDEDDIGIDDPDLGWRPPPEIVLKYPDPQKTFYNKIQIFDSAWGHEFVYEQQILIDYITKILEIINVNHIEYIRTRVFGDETFDYIRQLDGIYNQTRRVYASLGFLRIIIMILIRNVSVIKPEGFTPPDHLIRTYAHQFFP